MPAYPARAASALLPLLVLGLASSAHAINKCQGPDGSITFSDMPCPTTSKAETVRVTSSRVGGGGGPWDGLCHARFTRGMQVKDVFDEVELEIRAGANYLLSKAHGVLGYTILYPTPRGMVSFNIKPEKGNPVFSEGCTDGKAKQRIAVFVDTTLYADQGMGRVACRLTRGTLLEGGSYMYQYASTLGEREGKAEYSFGSAAPACGKGSLYAVMGSSEIMRKNYTALPISQVLAPASK